MSSDTLHRDVAEHETGAQRAPSASSPPPLGLHGTPGFRYASAFKGAVGSPTRLQSRHTATRGPTRLVGGGVPTLPSTPTYPSPRSAMRRKPQPQGLYDPQYEHDACGVAFVASIAGERS